MVTGKRFRQTENIPGPGFTRAQVILSREVELESFGAWNETRVRAVLMTGSLTRFRSLSRGEHNIFFDDHVQVLVWLLWGLA